MYTPVSLDTITNVLHSRPPKEGESRMATVRVGFIGLREMERPMTRRMLAAGFEYAEGRGARLLLGSMSLELYKEAAQLGHGDINISAMCLLLERIADTEIRPKAE